MSEKGEIKRMGAKAHKNSGRGMVKGDASWNEFVVDIKEANKTFTLSQNVWAKIVTDTLKVDRNKSPLLQIVIGTENKKVRLAIIEWSELERLVDGNDNS
jgi:hypothetical protein